MYVFPGEHIRNWRSRYFILKDDGLFIGFRQKPASEAELNDPLNNFTVRNCEIIESNRPKPFTFSIRGLQACSLLLYEFKSPTPFIMQLQGVPSACGPWLG